jgi:sugar phosphate isomerase/epimerase
VWREALQGRDLVVTGKMVRDAGLSVVSLCRAGFFPSVDLDAQQEAIDENRRAIDQAAELGAPLLVLVCGADPKQPLEYSRNQIADGIAEILPHAAACGVRLGIEPLHPMYADTRSAIITLSQANNLCESLDSDYLGVVVDVYHLWWDSNLEVEVKRSGKAGKLFAFHVCDWRVPTEDMLYDRGLMGEGCIPIRQIRNWVEATGYDNFIEVEIFSHRYWAADQETFLDSIVRAYLTHV